MARRVPFPRRLLTNDLCLHILRPVTQDRAPREVAEVCAAAVELSRTSGGDEPVFQAVDGLAHRRGVARPQEAVRNALALGFLQFEGGLTNETLIHPRVAGYHLVEPRDALLHQFFVQALRSLVDRWDREKLLSPTKAQRVVVFASELRLATELSPTDLKIVGRLFDVEPVGQVEWFEDAASPWSIEIDFWIRDFANVGNVGDYLGVLREISL